MCAQLFNGLIIQPLHARRFPSIRYTDETLPVVNRWRRSCRQLFNALKSGNVRHEYVEVQLAAFLFF